MNICDKLKAIREEADPKTMESIEVPLYMACRAKLKAQV